ncbi:MAG TPA: glycerol-3-phosphate 1-O-acyltransferase PlsY [Fimbriimonadaceae bacterium]|nr:glycerol-3-phosphate 1-O-acyltransferase PlsY [Fimbriimonadaceae bacterium]
MVYAVLAVCAYLLGSVPFGVLVARAKGVDIMAVGSGNTGATNVARTLGWGLGIFVFALDVLKGAVPAVATMQVTGSQDAAVLVGVAAVLGHTLSPFLRFKGGKGVATGLGVLVGSAPIVGGAAFLVFLVLFGITRVVSVSSLVAALAVLVAAWFTKQGTVFFAVFTPLVAYVFYRHRANIGRLLKGEEPKFGKKNDRDKGDA